MLSLIHIYQVGQHGDRLAVEAVQQLADWGDDGQQAGCAVLYAALCIHAQAKALCFFQILKDCLLYTSLQPSCKYLRLSCILS